MTLKNLGLTVFAGLALGACDKLGDGTDGGNNNNPDSGVPTETPCPGPLPTAPITCTAAECSNTTGTKNFGEATLESTAGKSWIIPVWAASSILSDNTTIDYMTTTSALTPKESRSQEALQKRVREFLGDEEYARLFRDERSARIRGEAQLREERYKGPVSFAGVRGTAIRGRTREIVGEGVHFQATACSAAAPDCGSTMLCVIPEGTTDGTCEGSLSLKFKTGSTTSDPVTASVKRVGMFAAIAVDDGDPAVSDSDLDEILARFDSHIAPLDHLFFGMPKDAQGNDRDSNGKALLLLTKRVATRSRAGGALVGYFEPTDMVPSATDATSNAADILYLQPPGSGITLDGISGTLAHEYQHLINYTQKKIVRNAGPEDLWLDEGLSGFAEDIAGYGGDAFENIAAYMATFDQVSLTGAGLTGEQDSNPRRGMAHLFVRYYFEQSGGATFQSPGAASGGGIAAVKKLVESADTGTFLFTEGTTSRSFEDWVGDLITTAAIDGAGYEGVSCNPKWTLKAPETDSYTNNQRGIDLRSSFKNAAGSTVPLNGPIKATLGNDTGIELPGNGGEIREATTATGMVKMSITGSVDYTIGFRPLPSSK